MQKVMNEEEEIKRILEERIRLADSPDAIWYDEEEVFAEIEARNQNPLSDREPGL
jgi:hypothetical protein